MDEAPKILYKKGDIISFLRFTRSRDGREIIDVERLEGTIMDLAPDLPEPYIVGMYRDNGSYWETYAGATESTKLIFPKQKPLENGPKRQYIEYRDEDFRP